MSSPKHTERTAAEIRSEISDLTYGTGRGYPNRGSKRMLQIEELRHELRAVLTAAAAPEPERVTICGLHGVHAAAPAAPAPVNGNVDAPEGPPQPDNNGSKLEYRTKQRLAVIANYREENKRLRDSNSELLAALKAVATKLGEHEGKGDKRGPKLIVDAFFTATNAIAKHEGRAS